MPGNLFPYRFLAVASYYVDSSSFMIIIVFCSTSHAHVDDTKKRQSFPATGLERPLGFQEVEATEFLDNRHMKVVRLSDLGTGRLYLQERFLVLISVRGSVDARATMRPERLRH
jgi:hypothetical protein